MTNQKHPITPPLEMVEQWADMLSSRSDYAVFSLAAQWGADQEMEACCQHVQKDVTEFTSHAHLCAQRKSDGLRAARRPKPPSEAEQALAALEADPKDGAMIMIDAEQFSIVHHALQRLKELEAVLNG
jgi:hypothetical protein